MTDWIDGLTPAEREEWDRWVAHVRRETVTKMADCGFVMSLVPEGETDIKFAVELGLAIMLDKPIIAIAAPGAKVPRRLLRAADKVVYADVDTEEGQRRIVAVLSGMPKRLSA